MSKPTTNETSWLDDAFDDKKAAEELERARMSSGARTAVGIGMLVAVIALIAIIGLACMSLATLSNGLA